MKSEHPTPWSLRPWGWKADSSLGRASCGGSTKALTLGTGPSQAGPAHIVSWPLLESWVYAHSYLKAFLMSALVSDGAWQSSHWPPGVRTRQVGIWVGFDILQQWSCIRDNQMSVPG